MATKTPKIDWLSINLQGVTLAMNHKILMMMALFAALCSKTVGIFTRSRGIHLDELFRAHLQLLIDAYVDPAGGARRIADLVFHPMDVPAAMGPLWNVVLFLPLLLFLWLGSGFIFAGILSLIFQALQDRGYKVQDLMPHGRRFFLPVLIMKIPVSAVTTAAMLAVIPRILLDGSQLTGSYPRWGMAIVLSAVMIFPAMITISLGPKVMVAEDLLRVIPVHRRLWTIVRDHLPAVAEFYLLGTLAWVVALGTPVMFLHYGAPEGLMILFGLLIFAFWGVVQRASVFILYMTLVGKAPALAYAIDEEEDLPTPEPRA